MQKVDFYTLIHKAIRRRLFLVSIQIGRTDFDEEESFSELRQEILSVIQLLKEHAHHEETYFHPLIVNALPEVSLDSEHQHHEKSLQAIESRLTEISLSPQKTELWLMLYSDFNIFIANYMQHLATEELIMPVLWQHYSQEELLKALQTMLQSFSEQYLKESMDYMLPALNFHEKSLLGT